MFLLTAVVVVGVFGWRYLIGRGVGEGQVVEKVERLVDEEGKVWEPSQEQLAQVTSVGERVFGNISVGGLKLRVEVVDTPEREQTGLSYRERIGADGMLFVLPRRGFPSFWMRGMRFPIDFVWIDCGQLATDDQQLTTECEVVDVIENVFPPENPEDRDQLQIYQPLAPVTHVLEVNGGWVGESGVEMGDKVGFW